jgi:hypothetical protein
MKVMFEYTAYYCIGLVVLPKSLVSRRKYRARASSPPSVDGTRSAHSRLGTISVAHEDSPHKVTALFSPGSVLSSYSILVMCHIATIPRQGRTFLPRLFDSLANRLCRRSAIFVR